MSGKPNFGKKGLSPLIATVLLLVFALVLGAITMNLGKSYVGSSIKEKDIFASAIVINPKEVTEPLQKLQIRYITGDISKEEYLQMEKELLGKS